MIPPPPPPVTQVGSAWFFCDEHGGWHGPFARMAEALQGCEIYADCVLKEQDVLTFSSLRYRFLSNFWYAEVAYDGLIYPSTEHAYQAAKTPSEEARGRILLAPSCAVAKQMGRYVQLREDWEDIKVSVMLGLLRQKFQHEPLRLWLRYTGSARLVEGNTWGDAFWGVTQNGTGRGRNELGRLLMDVRAELRSGRTECEPP